MNKLQSVFCTAIIIFLSLSVTVFSQTSAEIEAAKAMARSYGYSDSEINAMVNRTQTTTGSSVSVPQVSRITGTQASTTTTSNVLPELDFDKLVDSLVNSSKPKIYGHDIFQSPALNFVPSYNIPTPVDYKLAPDDEVVIDLWGAAVLNTSQTISPEGSITIPEIGPVYLAGRTITQAEAALREQLSKIYSGILGSEPNTFLRLSIGRIRSFSVNVVGDVERPGTYTLPSLSTVFSALYMAGGSTYLGTVRDIKVYRNNKLVKTFDVYGFIVDGDFSANIRLEDNDLIKVGTYTNMVSIAGQVKRPMRYETKDNETIAELLGYAGGFADAANTSRIHVSRKKGTRSESFDVMSDQFNSFRLVDGDSLTIFSNVTDNLNRVYLQGAVWHQGSYAISDDMNTLQQLIEAAGGLREEAYEKRGYIQRFNELRDTVAVHFNVRNVVDGIEDVMLMPDDSIRIFANHELNSGSVVYTFGEVNKEDTLAYRRGMTLGDAILLSGGLHIGASRTNIGVARRNVNDASVERSDSIAIIYGFNFYENPDAEDFELEPFDMIFVRTSPDYRHQQTITVEGEVNFPGKYVVEKNEVRLSDIIRRSGGFNKDAYVRGAVLKRKISEEEYERLVLANEMAKQQAGADSSAFEVVDRNSTYNIGIDMQAAVDNPGSNADVVLRTDDVVSVPKMNNTVRISGAVSFENVVSYNPSLSPRQYINMAGGFRKHAMRNNTYIVYMNGTVTKKGDRNFKVEPGCEIVVPLKDVSGDRGMSAAQVLSLTTSTASLAAIIMSLINAIK